MKYSIRLCIASSLMVAQLATACATTNLVACSATVPPAQPVSAHSEAPEDPNQQVATGASDGVPAPSIADVNDRTEPAETPRQVIVVVEDTTQDDVEYTWYYRRLRSAEVLDLRARELRLAQTAAEVAAAKAVAAMNAAATADSERRSATGIVRAFWFDTSAEAQRGAALLKVIAAAQLANEHAEASEKVKAAAIGLEAASQRLLARVSDEVSTTTKNIRSRVDDANRAVAGAAAIAKRAKDEEAKVSR